MKIIIHNMITTLKKLLEIVHLVETTMSYSSQIKNIFIKLNLLKKDENKINTVEVLTKNIINEKLIVTQPPIPPIVRDEPYNLRECFFKTFKQICEIYSKSHERTFFSTIINLIFWLGKGLFFLGTCLASIYIFLICYVNNIWGLLCFLTLVLIAGRFFFKLPTIIIKSYPHNKLLQYFIKLFSGLILIFWGLYGLTLNQTTPNEMGNILILGSTYNLYLLTLIVVGFIISWFMIPPIINKFWPKNNLSKNQVSIASGLGLGLFHNHLPSEPFSIYRNYTIEEKNLWLDSIRKFLETNNFSTEEIKLLFQDINIDDLRSIQQLISFIESRRQAFESLTYKNIFLPDNIKIRSSWFENVTSFVYYHPWLTIGLCLFTIGLIYANIKDRQISVAVPIAPDHNLVMDIVIKMFDNKLQALEILSNEIENIKVVMGLQTVNINALKETLTHVLKFQNEMIQMMQMGRPLDANVKVQLDLFNQAVTI